MKSPALSYRCPARQYSTDGSSPGQIRNPIFRRILPNRDPGCTHLIIRDSIAIASNQSQSYATATTANVDAPVELSEEQMKQLEVAHRLRKRLNQGLQKTMHEQKLGSVVGLPIDTVLRSLAGSTMPTEPEEAHLLGTVERVYAGQPFAVVQNDLSKAAMHRNPSQRKVTDTNTKQILAKLRLLDVNSDGKSGETPDSKPIENSDDTPKSPEEIQEIPSVPMSSSFFSDQPAQSTKQAPRPRAPLPKRRRSLAEALAKAQLARQEKMENQEGSKTIRRLISHPPFPTKAQLTILNPDDLELSPIKLETQPRIPELSFDLSRVLFNPGVYQLRDPRSRVYNFDPYLEKPMAITEFNFDALNPYVTSSEDQDLLGLARGFSKRYIGSSSSMSSALCQFHFLLSQWRSLNTTQMSKGFQDSRVDFTIITRAPSAIFLRYRDGVYAVDADKEFDTPNVLMSLGKSLEKLLTLEKEELEKWRRTHTEADKSFSDSQEEAFHYSTQGSFLLRSQLDAYDSRLPGSGIFDLKTRAVAGIRMNMAAHEEGMGYQIRERFGTWESYEREYYDMMRSNFLKYSMQVRMGNMDGIFVAYHNIEQIFGFQYISIADMDFAIHGQHDPTLGDQEFKLSINLLQTIFDKVTQQFPEQSIRFHFETKEPTASDPKTYMNIFAQPMTNQEIDNIQKRQHDEFAAFENRVFKGQEQTDASTPEVQESQDEKKEDPAPRDDSASTLTTSESSSNSSTSSTSSIAADTAFLDTIDGILPADIKPKGPPQLVAFKLEIQNRINDRPITRPEKLTSESQWSVAYKLEQLSEESAWRQYNFCKNRRQSALSMGKREVTNFIQNIRNMSSEGAEYRQKQVEEDAQRETVVLYQDRIKS